MLRIYFSMQDSNEDAVVFLKKRGLTQYSVSLGKTYLNKLLFIRKNLAYALKDLRKLRIIRIISRIQLLK